MDYKEFLIGDTALAVAQITCTDSASMLERKAEFLPLMEKMAKEKGMSMMLLMLTDVLLEGSAILFVGDEDIIRQAFNAHPKDNVVFLPRVMSRKKQVIPMLSDLWG
jgi:manganese-dependent inorganic pyrophosphatase